MTVTATALLAALRSSWGAILFAAASVSLLTILIVAAIVLAIVLIVYFLRRA